MCNTSDFASLKLGSYRNILETELARWHEWYLPVKGTVLDLGAGAGETAQFFLNHGADRVVCIEADPEALRLLHENFDNDKRITIVAAHLDKIKSDIEGSERDMTVEVHFPFKIKKHTDTNVAYHSFSTIVLKEDWGNSLQKLMRRLTRRFQT